MVHNSGRSECSGARRLGTVSAMPSGVPGPPILRGERCCAGAPPELPRAQRRESTGALRTGLLWGLHLAQLEILALVGKMVACVSPHTTCPD